MRLDRLVKLHRHQQMRSALQVEAELDLGRSESSPIGHLDASARQQDQYRRHHDGPGNVDAGEAAAVGEMHVEKGHDQHEQNQDRSETLRLFHYS